MQSPLTRGHAPNAWRSCAPWLRSLFPHARRRPYKTPRNLQKLRWSVPPYFDRKYLRWLGPRIIPPCETGLGRPSHPASLDSHAAHHPRVGCSDQPTADTPGSPCRIPRRWRRTPRSLAVPFHAPAQCRTVTRRHAGQKAHWSQSACRA